MIGCFLTYSRINVLAKDEIILTLLSLHLNLAGLVDLADLVGLAGLADLADFFERRDEEEEGDGENTEFNGDALSKSTNCLFLRVLISVSNIAYIISKYKCTHSHLL